jgi:hypothetical protein
MSVSAYRSATCRTGKEYGRKREVNIQKLMQNRRDFPFNSQWSNSTLGRLIPRTCRVEDKEEDLLKFDYFLILPSFDVHMSYMQQETVV